MNSDQAQLQWTWKALLWEDCGLVLCGCEERSCKAKPPQVNEEGLLWSLAGLAPRHFSVDALRQPMCTRDPSAARKLSANGIEFHPEPGLTLFNAQLNALTIYFILCFWRCDPRPSRRWLP